MFIGSKIQFSESKSQLLLIWINSISSCLSVQRYNFLKANHNYFIFYKIWKSVVYRFKDTIFWKQITTCSFLSVIAAMLFIGSKIQFSESKSQLLSTQSNQWYRCLSVQRYNFLKANHNSVLYGKPNVSVVYRFKDTIFWKQITTLTRIIEFFYLLFIGSKIQFSESKSQLIASAEDFFLVVYRFKDTIFWKQITTLCDTCTIRNWLFIGSKIQFSESKSQRI